MLDKRIVLTSSSVGIVALFVTFGGVSSAESVGCGILPVQTSSSQPLFKEQDKVLLFAGPDQNGVITGILAGTVTGKTPNGKVALNGTSAVNFRLFLTGPTTFNFDLRVGITDTDGDQLIYR